MVRGCAFLFPERDASNGAECDISRGIEDQATPNVCTAVQSLLQVTDDQAGCVQFRNVKQIFVDSLIRVTSKTTDVFCPSCGNKMLMKVTVTVDAQGNILYQPLSVKQFSRKGLRVSF